MELSNFLRQLYKRWLLLICVPIVAMAVAYYFVRDMPSTFTAHATVATGLVDETQHTLSVGGLTLQESQINQQFSNVIEMMKLKKIMDKVSYLLIIHDLSQPNPFKKPSKLLKAMSAGEKQRTTVFFKHKYDTEVELNLWDSSENQRFKLLESMKYDGTTIGNNINIHRKNNSDYIEVEYSSESAELSPFIVNSVCNEFIKSYDSIVLKNKTKASDYLGDLMRKKYVVMNDKIALLKNYKIENKVLNLNEQAKILYNTIVLVDSRKQDAQKEIESYTGAINNIDSKFNPNDRKYLEGALTSLNRNILETKTKLQTLSDQYLKSEYNDGYRKSMDSMQHILNGQINALNDQYIYDPLSAKKDLMTQKLTLEIQRDISRNSLNGLIKESDAFNQRFNRLVPFEAVVQSYERDIDIASREYLDILNKYNLLGTDPDNNIKLSQVQIAMPSAGAPTKKILFILVAGIIAFVLCVVILFVMFFFDDAITSPTQLAQKTQVPVLGYLHQHTGNVVDLFALWNGNSASNAEFTAQKALLRSIRYEVAQELGNKKTVCVTSLKSGSGSTFLSINLAYAFATMHKKVLLVDGNFSNPSISKMLPPTIEINALFTTDQIDTSDFVSVVGNTTESRSPFEIASEQKIKDAFQLLPFDIIIIDTPALEKGNETREWIACADKIITVFENKRTLTVQGMQQIEWLKQTGKFVGFVLNKHAATVA